MFRTVLFSFPGSHALGNRHLFGTILLISMVILPSFGHTKNSSRKHQTQESDIATPALIASPNPDQLLIEIYSSLAANNLQLAQLKADELTQAYPNFQLGHLIRGDLLAMHTRPVTGFGTNLNTTAENLMTSGKKQSPELKRFVKNLTRN